MDLYTCLPPPVSTLLCLLVSLLLFPAKPKTVLSLGLRWWWFDAEAEKEAARGLKTGEALLI